MGGAQELPPNPALGALQRSALVIGVNATVEVLASDVLRAVMMLIEPSVVDLKNYMRPVDRPTEVIRITPNSGPIDARSVPITYAPAESRPPLILPPTFEPN